MPNKHSSMFTKVPAGKSYTICKSSRPETAWATLSRRAVPIVVPSPEHDSIEGERANYNTHNMNEPQRRNAEPMKPDTKAYIPYHSLYGT